MDDQQTQAPSELTDLLKTMLEPDGYTFTIRTWPEGGHGNATVEIIASADACEDCLVPKEIMTAVLSKHLPAGIELNANGLIYPGEAVPE